MVDLSDVRYIKRIVIGSSNPSRMQTEQELAQSQALLNRCLNESPRGSIVGIERSFTLLQLGEHQVVMQWLCYHVGFALRPLCLQEQP